MHGNLGMTRARRRQKLILVREPNGREPNRHDMIHGFGQPSLSVYVIKAGEAVKIGTSNDVGNRAIALQTSQQNDVMVWWAARLLRKDAQAVEREVHKELRKTAAYARGEWSYLDPEVAVNVIKRVIERLDVKARPDLTYGYRERA